MKIYYQWSKWAYSQIVSEIIQKKLNKKLDIADWLVSFSDVWDKIEEGNIWVLPIENSYAWSIHDNLYNFLRFNYQVIWEYNLNIDHCLLSNEKDLKKIKAVYSHPQALSQCHNFLHKYKIKPMPFSDTAAGAKMISEKKEMWVWVIASKQAWKIYKLNCVAEKIQDQNWNTTRFFIVAKKNSNIKYLNFAWKVSLIFEARNIPASLYKCLWAFATNWINLTKIESLPSLLNPFTYFFWLDFEWSLNDKKVKWSLKELEFFTNSVKILGEY